MNGLPYYKAYPRDFLDGTVGMALEVKGAYRIILDLIYLQGGSLPDDAGYISGHLGCSKRKWTAIRSTLISLGKLTVSNGLISNYRAIIEVENARKFQDKQAKNARGPRKNKGLRKPRPSHTDTEYTEAKASAADAADLSRVIFGPGLRLLTGNGVPDGQARAMLGRWRKEHGDETLLAALGKAQREGALDPIGFVQGCFRAKKGNGNAKTARLMQMADCLDRRAEAEREVGHGESAFPSQPLLPAVGGGRR